MTGYSKCHSCGRKGACEFLAKAKAALKGHGALISSVKVKCGKAYENDFPRGSRVTIKGGEYGSISQKARRMFGLSGTLINWRQDGKATVLMDKNVEGYDGLAMDWGGHDYMELCRAQSFAHRDLEALDEPLRPFCAMCGIVADGNGNPESYRVREDVVKCYWPTRFEGNGVCLTQAGCKTGEAL